ALVEEEPDPPGGGVDLSGGVAGGGPAGAEDGVGGMRSGAAHGPAEPEEVPQRGGYDVRRRLLGGGEDDDAGRPAPGYEVPEHVGELLPFLPLRGGQIV